MRVVLAQLMVLAITVSAFAQIESSASEPADGKITLENVVPVVIKTVPVAGADGVDPNLGTISVTFSKKMQDGSWSWVQMSEDSFPTMRGKPRYLKDSRTNVLDVTLKPNQTYAIWFNSDKFRNFKDEQGRAALPYLLGFRTGDGKADTPIGSEE